MEVLEEVIKEATPRIISQDPMHTHWDPFGVNDFNVDGYTENVNPLLEPPNFSTTPSWVEKYESMPAPIASSLESSPPQELKSPLVTPKYTYLESSHTLLAPIVSDSTPNPKI